METIAICIAAVLIAFVLFATILMMTGTVTYNVVSEPDTTQGLTSSQAERVIENCLYLLERMKTNASYYDVMHATESYDRIAAMLFDAANLVDEWEEIQARPVSYSSPHQLINTFQTLRAAKKEV